MNSFLPSRIDGKAQLVENDTLKTGTWGRTTGEVSTEPFQAPHFLMVPLRGLTYEGNTGPELNPGAFRPADASVALECVVDGRRIELLKAPSFMWFSRVIEVPKRWCSSEVRIVARASVPGVQIGFGTPFRVDHFDWLVSGPFGALMALAFALLVIGLQTAPWLVDPDTPAQRRIACALLWPVANGLLIYVLGYRGVGTSVLT